MFVVNGAAQTISIAQRNFINLRDVKFLGTVALLTKYQILPVTLKTISQITRPSPESSNMV